MSDGKESGNGGVSSALLDGWAATLFHGDEVIAAAAAAAFCIMAGSCAAPQLFSVHPLSLLLRGSGGP